MDSIVNFNGSKNLDELSPARKNSLYDLVDFHEYVKPSFKSTNPRLPFVCGPFKNSTEWELLGDAGTKYYINEYGFRGEWPVFSKDKKIAVFGDSCTFGVGVDQDDLYTTKLAKYFPDHTIFNFGMVGSSIDNIVKCYSVAERLIGFDKALFFLPDYSRFCWPKYENEWQHSNIILGPGLDESNKDHMTYIRNYWDELEVHRAINYLNWLNDISNINDSIVSVWSWSRATNDIIRQVLPKESVALIDPGQVEIDHARDHQHPGPKSHEAVADYWWEQLVLS
jgi:hypothetical protein